MQSNSPCQAHAIYGRNTHIGYSATLRNNITASPTSQNDKFAQILSKPSAKQSTTFSTFKPPYINDNSEGSFYDKFNTYQSRKGILKLPGISENSTICTCETVDQSITEGGHQPDVIRSSDVLQKNDTNNQNHDAVISNSINKEREDNSDNQKTDTSMTKPQVMLLPKTNNATTNA